MDEFVAECASVVVFDVEEMWSFEDDEAFAGAGDTGDADLGKGVGV